MDKYVVRFSETNSRTVLATSFDDAERKAAILANGKPHVVLGRVVAVVPDYGLATSVGVKAYVSMANAWRKLLTG